MSPRRTRRSANIGRQTNRSRAMRAVRMNETQESRNSRNDAAREYMAALRASQTDDEIAGQRIDGRDTRANARAARHRHPENVVADNANRRVIRRARVAEYERAAFQYDPNLDYDEASYIGRMNVICRYCKAFKFRGETPGMCCASGKVKLPPLPPPPQALNELLSGNNNRSKHFLKNISRYNSCFQMTSFGATTIVQDNFMPTFKVISTCGMNNIHVKEFNKTVVDLYTMPDCSAYFHQLLQIQGQVYHRAGSLLPIADADHQFLQIYFMGNSEEELDRRCQITTQMRREIIETLQNLLHEHNELIRLFTTALDRMQADDYKIIIKADKTPAGEHARRFNAPTIDEVAMVGETFTSRDIVLHRRNEQIQRVSETHRSYDALQYPLLHWRGDDGYHFNIKQVNPLTCK